MEYRRARFRCPVPDCRTIYWNARATCVGGWPVHDPARPGAFVPEHDEVRVVPDGAVGLSRVQLTEDGQE